MTTEEPTILTKTENGVLWITLNRPQAQNAITPDQRDELVSLFEGASASLSTRCVVLTATGRGFCTGADLRVSRVPEAEKIEGAPDRPMGQVARLIRSGAQKLIGSILDCEKPVIAAVNGPAAGAGLGLALACDLRIASSSANFTMAFINIGLVPDTGTAWLLPVVVGYGRAVELAFSGRRVPADEALSIGLVHRVVEPDQLETEAHAWATKLAAGPTLAYARTKAIMRRAVESDLMTAVALERDEQDRAGRTSDHLEGVQAFLAKRPPVYEGR